MMTENAVVKRAFSLSLKPRRQLLLCLKTSLALFPGADARARAIKHMCIQCVPGAISPPSPPRLGMRLNASYAHVNLIACLVSILMELLPACFNICIHNICVGSVQVGILNAGTTLTDADDNFTCQVVDPGIALGLVCIQRVVATTCQLNCEAGRSTASLNHCFMIASFREWLGSKRVLG